MKGDRDGAAPRAKRSLGQNFLVSEAVIDRIAETCRFLSAEAEGIVEVGPGRGALTDRLAALGKALWAVELDGELAAQLAERLPDVQVTEGDARAFDWCSLWRISGLHPWLFVGNLPYNAGTEILWQALLRRDTFRALVVMLQREVAEKFCAPHGEEGYGPYSAWTHPWWEGQVLFTVKPGAFRPQPKVTSAVCAFTPRRVIPLSSSLQQDYWAFIQRAFRHPRKTLLANLAAGSEGRAFWEGKLRAARVEALDRPAQVPAGAYVKLFEALSRR